MGSDPPDAPEVLRWFPGQKKHILGGKTRGGSIFRRSIFKGGCVQRLGLRIRPQAQIVMPDTMGWVPIPPEPEYGGKTANNQISGIIPPIPV